MLPARGQVRTTHAGWFAMLTRRQFLETGCALAAAPGTAALINDAQARVAAEVPEYRALVCISLGGGADSFNMLVPTDGSRYSTYRERRGNLALSPDELLTLQRGDGAGGSYALHVGLREVHKLYSAGEIAILANAGPLERPNHYRGVRRVPDLSHAGLIARWQYGTAGRRPHSGWAGRAADFFADLGWHGLVPVNISLSGRNATQLGEHTVPAILRSSPNQRRSDLPASVDFSYINEQLADSAMSRGRPGSRLRRSRRLESVAADSKRALEDAFKGVAAINTSFAPESFSADLAEVARIIAARRRLRVRRQLFFVQFDGWDHHHQLRQSLSVLLPELSRGLAAFRDALVELGVFDDVTTFTTSEFGRSLESNGSGSDHGWGGHHIVMGGAIRGGRVYGRYPDLSAHNPLDAGGGSFMPTTSMEEYLGELLAWLGIPPADLPDVLPDSPKFWSLGSSMRPVGMFA